jgi:hypothetical protein
MGLIKKIDVEKHFAARRAMRLGRTGPLSPLGAAGIKSAAERKRVPASAEALTSGHSSPSVSSASIPIPSDPRRNRLLRPPGVRQQ